MSVKIERIFPAITIKEAKEGFRRHLANQEWDAAFRLGMEVLYHAPIHDDIWSALQRIAPRVDSGVLDKRQLVWMTSILERFPSNPSAAALLALQALCANYPVLAAYLQLIGAGRMGAEEIEPEDLDSLFDESLWHALLKSAVVPHMGLERLLTLLRARLLFLLREKKGQLRRDVLLSLATQCHINGYIYSRTAREEALLYEVQKEIESGEENEYEFLLWSCYAPPSSLQCMPAFEQARKQDTGLDDFLRMSVEEIVRERYLDQKISSLGTIEDAVSQAVREQYEEHPYPRWLHLADIPEETPAQFLKRFFPRFSQAPLRVDAEAEILIAGCGTGKQALEAARRYPRAQVTAVDLSRASLAYALRKTEEYGIENITYCQVDILKLGELGRAFDIIESCGVLHHMHDPMAGWKAIADLLKPGGIIKIALYSAKARESITRCREEIAARNIGGSEQAIREYRDTLIQEPDAWKRYPFVLSTDFFSMPECRDLLFHPQEHCFALPEIAEAVDRLKLKFIGFDVSDETMIKSYIERFPQDPYWNDLNNWHVLEQEKPLMFFGMYQFWCYKPL